MKCLMREKGTLSHLNSVKVEKLRHVWLYFYFFTKENRCKNFSFLDIYMISLLD